MYEKLDKLRAEVERWKRRVESDKAKQKAAEDRLKEAESTQILADVNALNLSPEQLAECLKLVASGRPAVETHDLAFKTKANDNDPDEDYNESEDTEDEEN